MLDFPGVRPSGREWATVATVAALASAAGSVGLGPDANFDLLNYHLYDGFALLAGRLDRDLAPAGPATYFNPLLDALHYVGIRHLSPKAFATLLGALQGTNVLLVWAVARSLLGPRGLWLAPLAALLGATGQNAVSLLGTTFGDNTVSILALVAVLAVVGAECPGRAWLAIAGALGGAAVGVKLTMAAPHVGLTVLATWLAWKHRRPALLGAFVLGSVAGWGLTNGWWAVEMWRRLGNPLFPFLNDIFQSPFAPATPLRDLRWRSGGFPMWLLPAVDAALGINDRLQEVSLRDPRLLLVFLAVLAWLASQLARVLAGRPLAGTGRGLLLYWIAGYGAWVAAFHYYRYASVLEFLAPTVALVLLAEVWPYRMAVVAPAVAVVVLVTTSVGSWYRASEWSPFWFNPRLPEIGLRPDQLILLPDPGTSFVAPFFPRDAAFVGLSYSALRGPALTEAIAARVRTHTGPLRALVTAQGSGERTDEAVRAFGLEVSGPCEWAKLGRGYRYLLCPLERHEVDSAQPADTLTTSSSSRSPQPGR
jgi:hypothetical protein